MEILRKLKSLDAYPKVNEDFHRRTLSGGIITLVSFIIIFLLLVSELRLYFYAATETKLVVDTSRGESLHINFDVTFPHVACSLLSIDTEGISGEQHHNIMHDILKTRIDHLGTVIESRQGVVGEPKLERPLQRHGGRLTHNETYCGSCYGAEISDDDCCNSCEEVREAYGRKGWGLTNPELIDQEGPTCKACRFEVCGGPVICNLNPHKQCTREGFVQKIKEEEGEGCNAKGFVEVSKVAGNFHFAPGKSFHHSKNVIQDLLALPTESYNITHKINKLSFGQEFPGAMNPLDGVQWTQDKSSGMYQYFIKVVPTIYTDIRGHRIHSNQFSVTEHFRDANVHPQPPPGVYFFYDFSPIKVNLTEENKSFLHFLTNICAIIGGVFTVSGIIDSFVYHGHRAFKKKVELGKFR